MASQSPPSRSGKWIVVLILAFGACAGLLAVRYWTEQPIQGPGGPGDRGAGDADPAAREQFEQLSARVNAALQQNRVAQVRDAVVTFVERNPTYAPSHRLYAQVLMALPEPDREAAYQQIRVSLELDPKQPELRLLAGTVARDLKRPGEAIEHYTQAVALKPQDPNFHLHLAQAYFDQHQLERARQSAMDALALDSSSHKGYMLLSDLYARQNDLPQAMSMIQKAIDQTKATDSVARAVYVRRKAALLRRDNKPKEALLLLEGLAPTERSHPEALEEMALCFWLMGQPAEAPKLFEEAMSVDPNDWRLAAGAAWWHAKAGNLEAARRFLTLLRQLNPRAMVIDELESQLRDAGFANPDTTTLDLPPAPTDSDQPLPAMQEPNDPLPDAPAFPDQYKPAPEK